MCIRDSLSAIIFHNRHQCIKRSFSAIICHVSSTSWFYDKKPFLFQIRYTAVHNEMCIRDRNDKKFIDTIIDPRYPSLAKDKVKALAEADSNIESLLLLDERYNKYLEA